MYYNTKIQLIDLLDSLKEMVKIISNHEDNHIQFIKDCQLASSFIKSSIESCSIADNSIITLCEIFNMPFSEYNKNRKLIPTLCGNTKNFINNEIETRWRMFFLPYQFSMWHSMQSIYEAAVNDPRCDAYVMPLPYSSLNIDGSVQKSFCELKEFESYNPLDYKFVNLEQINPEFIFIHNPYDGYNNLTKIDEAYHSHNLKKCTNNLVYTPYFTFFDASKEACDRLILVPGVINADFIIAQSKKVEDAMLQRRIPKDKIITLGSPKIDKIIKLKANPPEMPKEWAKKLQNKKVILYTFAPAVSLSREWIEAVYNCMLTCWNDDEIAIIFRPHPLFLQFALNRKMNLDIVKRILDLPLNHDRIVLDYFSDSSYSYFFSDALMLSGTSSIMNEYLATTKPIYFDQVNFNCIDNSDNLFVDFRSIYCPTFNPETDILQDCHNKAVKNFFDIVKLRNEDIRFNDRLLALENGFLNSDASAGIKIYNKLISLL